MQMSMRVAGRLMQLERLEQAPSDVQFQGNKESLPPDLIDLFRRYEQVLFFIQQIGVPNFLKVGALFQVQPSSNEGGDSSFALFSLMIFLFMLSSWRRMRNTDNAAE